jgi:hypothetical protein
LGIGPVPDHQERRDGLAAGVPQGKDRPSARDAAAKMPRMQPAIGRDRDDAGDLAPLAHPPQHRRHPAPSPGRARPLAEAMAGLVEEQQGASLTAGLPF